VFKRVTLFLLTNLAVLLVLGVVMAALRYSGLLSGIDDYYVSLLVFAAVFGFGGAFISLLISKWVAKRATRARVISQPRDQVESWLLAVVRAHSERVGIKVPEVAIYDSPDMNAFATGPTRNNALVAVSTGLLHGMGRDEVEAVIGHEISHVSNGDMVTLTLLQGVLNTFVFFAARVIGDMVDKAVFRSRGRGPAYFITTILAQMVLGAVALIILMWFSRWREFRADAGSAALVGAPNMAAALRRLQRSVPSQLPDSVRAFGIRNGSRSKFAGLFRSHPPIEQRIARLQAGGSGARAAMLGLSRPG
jgi:heat shock protein HtpX